MKNQNAFLPPGNIDELHELASRPTKGVMTAMNEIDSDVMVLGAGGKMGFHLSWMIQRALNELQSPFRVIAVSRFGSADASSLFQSQNIETRSVDLTNKGSVQSLPDSKNIVYLAGIKFGASGNADLLHKMNIDLPALVANRFSGNGERIVALSTGCVYPFVSPKSGGAIETDRLDPPGDYAVSCLGRERSFIKSGARTSLIRLNYSVDLRYGVLVDIAQAVLQDRPVDVSTGFVNVIWQGDANAYIIQSLTHASSPAFIVNVTGARILNVRDIANRFGELFNRPVSFLGKESETAWLNNASRAHQLWGPPLVPENQLIEWVADWLERGGETLNKPTQFQVRDGQY